MLPDWIIGILRCPETGLPVNQTTNGLSRSDGTPIAAPDGIPSLVYPSVLTGSDAEMNRRYEWLAPFYSLSESILGWLLSGVRIGKGRREMVSLLQLQTGMRLLEVSPGPGVFHRMLRRAIGRKAEAAAVDLSQAMLLQCKRRHARRRFVLIRANAENLPFADASFDALFHFGGVNLFNEPERALREFVRVVKPGGIVAWGDEGMSPSYRHPIGRWLLPKMNPGFYKVPPPPPPGLRDLVRHEVYAGLGYLYVGRRQD
jgi:ubiquinone/menaquinone biosynthesis C-methylase UbiE